MSLMDWAPTALLLTVATYSIFLYVIYRGTAALSSQRIGQAVSHTGVSRLYVAALRRPVTTVAFYLCFFEIPIGVFIVTGIVISSEAATLLIQYSWFFLILAVGGLIAAVSMPKVVSGTGTEREEAAYWSDVADCREEIRNARARGLAAGFSSTSWRPSSKHNVQLIVEEAVQLRLNEKCMDVWLWEVFHEYEQLSARGISIRHPKPGALQDYLMTREQLMNREDDIGQAFRASLSRWKSRLSE